jgi:hypothetical protein
MDAHTCRIGAAVTDERTILDTRAAADTTGEARQYLFLNHCTLRPVTRQGTTPREPGLCHTNMKIPCDDRSIEGVGKAALEKAEEASEHASAFGTARKSTPLLV